MCRLFGLSAAPSRVRATFWLLEAPDSLARQSRHDPDGTGVGTFTADGMAQVDKRRWLLMRISSSRARPANVSR